MPRQSPFSAGCRSRSGSSGSLWHRRATLVARDDENTTRRRRTRRRRPALPALTVDDLDTASGERYLRALQDEPAVVLGRCKVIAALVTSPRRRKVVARATFCWSRVCSCVCNYLVRSDRHLDEEPDEARGHAPHHDDHRRRAEERRVLRRRARACGSSRRPSTSTRPTPTTCTSATRPARPARSSPGSSSPARARGRAGAGMIHTIQLGVASEASLDFWADRLAAKGYESERGERLAAPSRTTTACASSSSSPTTATRRCAPSTPRSRPSTRSSAWRARARTSPRRPGRRPRRC